MAGLGLALALAGGAVGLHAAADFPRGGRFRGSKLTQVLRDGLVGSAVRHRFGSKEMINPV